MSAEQAIPVRQLVRRMRNVLEIQVGELWIEGEVSNLRRQSSGHYYFSLKDETAQISCAMFGARRVASSKLLDDGAKVKVFGEVTLYEARGQAQLIVKQVKSAGQGDLQARFEALKAKLQAEGLFDQARKKALPFFPGRIGVVTSPTGAALQDILNVLQRRAPWLQVVLYPAAVQGAGAEHGIAAGVKALGKDESVEAIIVGRGGGSLEDLWNFNEEVVARAIAACPHPVISAVGHEIDFTISDFAADVRAPTPSAAAEFVVPDRGELLQRCDALGDALAKRVGQRVSGLLEKLDQIERFGFQSDRSRYLREYQQRLDLVAEDFEEAFDGFFELKKARLKELGGLHAASRPALALQRAREQLAVLAERLNRGVQQRLSSKGEKLDRLEELIRVMGPAAVLARGYSITLGPDGVPVTSAADLSEGDEIVSRFSDGEVQSTVHE